MFRVTLIAIPALLLAAPALAQQPAPLQQPLKVPPELTDPATAEKLAKMTQALGKAVMELPVGELEAIAQGREPTAADRKRTVRDSGKAKDPDFERDLQRQLAQARPTIDASLKALAAALPAMLQGLEQAGQALERAAANAPSPTYPKR